MVLLSRPAHLSFSSFPFSTDTVPYPGAQFLSTRRCSPLFAASTSHRDAVLLLPGTICLRISDRSPFFSSSWPASSGSQTPAMTRPQKRLCKAQEAFNSRSRILVSDGIADFDNSQSFDADFRVLAFTSHGSSEFALAEIENSADDASHAQYLYRNAEKSVPRRLKTAEELHFEAIQDYHLRYEEEGGYGHMNDDGVVHHPEDIMPSEAPQSPWDSDGKNAERKKSAQANMANINLSKSKTRRPYPSLQFTSPQNSSITIDKSKSAQTKDLESFQNPCRSDNEKDMQTKGLPSEDEGSRMEEENAKSEVTGDLTEDQQIRMELNKAAALARRNMRRCEEAVLEARAKGLSFPKFESLLVDKSWLEVLRLEFQKPYMERLHQFVSQEAAGRIPIYPPPAKLFNAFNSCPFDKVKVVIIGQDPYHGPGQAMGLCFSVEKGIKLPSSLSNIFLELQSDLNCEFPSHGNLEKWAHQGVLLLNTVLTVRDHHANSHAKKGWELFTDAAIRALAQQRSGIVFLLWGNQAQEKLRLIRKTSHHILKAFHPSGISAHRGFFECRSSFLQKHVVNFNLLKILVLDPINVFLWQAFLTM